MHRACSINVMRLRLKQDDITNDNVLEHVPAYVALMKWPEGTSLMISLLNGHFLYCNDKGEEIEPPQKNRRERVIYTQAAEDIPGRKEACEACDQFDQQKQKCPYCGCGTRRLWRSPGLPCPHPTNPRWTAQ